MANKNSSAPKLRWEECFAKLVLEKVFPDRFYQLSIADKPDLQSSVLDVGIEVTTAIPKAEKEKDHLFSQLTHGTGTPEQIERNKDRIRQLGGEYDDRGLMFSWIGYRDLNRIYSALEEKLKKLNGGGYHPFAKQYIFITDTNAIKDEKMSEIHSELCKRQEQFTVKFDSVFIYLYGRVLIEFDITSGNNHRYIIDDVTALADKAFHMVNW